MRVSFLFAFAFVYFVSLRASAHDGRVAVDVDGGACVAHEAFEREVEARGARVDATAEVRLRVRIRSANDGDVTVDVAGESPRGALASRSFVATSCSEAIAAAALLVALSSGREATAASEPEPAARTPAPPSVVLPMTVPTAPAIARETPVVREVREVREEARTTSPYASAALIGSSLGEGQIGGRLAVGLSAQRVWLPWMEVGAGASAPRAIEGGGGEASLTWLSARAAAAPIGAMLAPDIAASVYGGAEAGLLFASGAGTSRVDSRSRPWLAIITGARLRWDLGTRLFASAEAGAVVPLLRDEFVFLNGGRVYQTPAIGLQAAMSLGANFP